MAEKGITAKDLTSGVRGISEKNMLADFERFLKGVEADGFKIVPTLSTFADYIEKPRADIHEWFRLHPTASKQMRDMCADTIAMGAMLKKYVPNVTNFALKNWCGWEEAPQKSAPLHGLFCYAINYYTMTIYPLYTLKFFLRVVLRYVVVRITVLAVVAEVVINGLLNRRE